MADPSTTQTSCPIARLPNELLVEVLERAWEPPSHMSPSTFTAHYKQLYGLCLLSKQFARVVQPFLWRDVILRPKGDLNPDPVGRIVVTLRTTAIGAAVRTLKMSRYSLSVALRLDELAAELPNVEHLVLDDVGCVDMYEVAIFSNLRRLDAHRIVLSLANAAFFPRLTTIGFSGVDLTDYLKSQWAFDADTLPALRHLSLQSCVASEGSFERTVSFPRRGDAEAFFPHLAHALVNRLEDIQLNSGDLQSSNGWPFPSRSDEHQPVPILVHLSCVPHYGQTFGNWRTEVRYLQIDQMRVGDRGGLYRLAETFPHLRLLLLPLPLPSDPGSRFAQAAELRALEQWFQPQRLKIRTFDPDGPLDGLVVPEFRAYLREQAAAPARGGH
ncbi:hypothetical protein JCM10449v2_000345 [Rhodotorula kratochvilovae]